MRKDASERLTIEQMLQHPWLLHEGRSSGAMEDLTLTLTLTLTLPLTLTLALTLTLTLA